jgi:hypothetical protein
MNKKAQGLSMTTIIIAALALLVLVILATLLLNSTGNINEGTGCEGLGGKCQIEYCDEGYVKAPHSCAGDDEVCCMPI